MHTVGRGSKLLLMSSQKIGKLTEVVWVESVGQGPGWSLEQDSALGPEGSRDSIEETVRKSWKQGSF